MNKLYVLVLVISIASCDHFKAVTSNNATAYDTVGVKKDINNAFDSMHLSFKSRNFNNMLSYLADDGTYLGTDPGEIWTKQKLGEYLSKAITDSTKMDYTIANRMIMPDEDGRSAIVVEQFYITAMSNKMQVRTVSRADYKNNRWLIDFYSWNFIPKNEDIPKINAALGK